jgi:hypothetical protein
VRHCGVEPDGERWKWRGNGGEKRMGKSRRGWKGMWSGGEDGEAPH